MSRITGRSARAKRYRPSPVTKRQIRKTIKKGQLTIRKATLEVRAPISMRGRTHVMQEEVPGITIHQLPQQLLLQSTAIKRIKYWIDEKRLRIWFVKKGIYDYYNVPESTVITLSQAQSKGNYFYYNIRTTYKFRRVDGTMAKKRKVKPLPKMTPKRRAKINKSEYKYNRKYYSTSTPKKKRKKR